MTENIQEKIEDKIIDCINLGVDGRLIIFKPEKKGFEDFLVVGRRGEYKDEEMYFEINGFAGYKKDNILTKDFFPESFKGKNSFYLIFVYFDGVKQKISDYVWLIPYLHFRDIAEVIKSPDGKKLLRFEAPLDFKQKNKYSKYIVSAKNLGKLILGALEKGESFIFENNAEEKIAINLDNLKDFLCEARRNTYASDNAPIDNPRLLSSKQLEFKKGEYFYRDIFFDGSKKFLGQEIIYENSRPIWGMNYIGDQIGKPETSFLKESLYELSEKCRLGEVCEHEKRGFKYQDKGQGDMADFSGREEIFSDGKSVYKLDYQGGLIFNK